MWEFFERLPSEKARCNNCQEEEDIELFYDDLEEDFEEGLVRNFLEEEEEEI